jgi:hypothetical protein
MNFGTSQDLANINNFPNFVGNRFFVRPVSVRLSVRHVTGLCKTKQQANIVITLPESLFLQLGRGIRSPLSDAVFDAKFHWKNTHPPEKRALP